VTAIINRHKIKTEITQNNTPPHKTQDRTKKIKQMCAVLNLTESGIIHIVVFLHILHISRKKFHAEREIRKRYGIPENTPQLTGYLTLLQHLVTL
jgi:hypothetical protein